MKETDKELVFSESVRAGKRIYYFDVKQSRNGDKYIAITESKKINEGTMENPRFVYEKHKLFLYKEDYEKFLNALQMTIDIASGAPIPIRETGGEDGEYVVGATEAKASEASTPAAEASPAATQAAKEEPAQPEKKGLLGKMLDIF